ncbi:MAG: hypothetical protein WBK51_06515 [Polaromonas sp.]
MRLLDTTGRGPEGKGGAIVPTGTEVVEEGVPPIGLPQVAQNREPAVLRALHALQAVKPLSVVEVVVPATGTALPHFLQNLALSRFSFPHFAHAIPIKNSCCFRFWCVVSGLESRIVQP